MPALIPPWRLRVSEADVTEDAVLDRPSAGVLALTFIFITGAITDVHPTLQLEWQRLQHISKTHTPPKRVRVQFVLPRPRCSCRSHVYPNVNAYASAPGSRNVISSVRSRTASARARAGRGGRPGARRSRPRRRPRRGPARSLAVEEHAEGIGSRAPGDSTRCASRAWKRKAMLPPAPSSTTFSRPIVHSPTSAQWLRRRRSGARRRGVVEGGAVGRRSAHRARSRGTSRACGGGPSRPPPPRRLLDGDELALDAEQPLDDALGLLVASSPKCWSGMTPSASTK